MADIRILLTDKSIAQLPAPKDGWYLARDTELKGFFVVVGKQKRTFTVQGDLRRDGKRASSIRVSIGDNDLRQTFRTIATSAGVSEFDAKLLMNHAIPGVNAGYITRHKLLENHLRSQQQAISAAIFAPLEAARAEHRPLRDWLGRGPSRRATQESQMKPADPDERKEWVQQAA